jgi:hypothetical protein
MPLGEKVGRLAREEMERAGSRAEAFSRIGDLNHATRLLDFLGRTHREFEEVSAAFVANLRRQDEMPDSRELFEEGGRLSVVVHHRVETFVALARVLLDRVAQAIERYFGPAPGVSLATHVELQSNLAAFAEHRGLRGVPPHLLTRAQLLTTQIVDDHDLHIRLLQGPPTMIASVWSSSGDAGMAPAGETGLGSITLDELMNLLEEHVEEVVDFLESNR